MTHPLSNINASPCMLCPRKCGVDRSTSLGFCGVPERPRAARAALHAWEEPCISGTRGSGTVFFSGCTLKCCFCQNYPTSAEGLGKEITIEHLAEIFLDLQKQGAHNINLVTPGQWRPWIIAALDIARAEGLRLPIVCNTGGYETVESVEAWRGYIDIWLADLKYVSSSLSAELSSAPDYFAQARPAIEAMMAQAAIRCSTARASYRKASSCGIWPCPATSTTVLPSSTGWPHGTRPTPAASSPVS